MTSVRTVKVRNRSGLHARPAARLVEVASEFDAESIVGLDGREARCKSLISVMKLGVIEGSELTLRAEGPDAIAALDRLEQFFANLGTE